MPHTMLFSLPEVLIGVDGGFRCRGPMQWGETVLIGSRDLTPSAHTSPWVAAGSVPRSSSGLPSGRRPYDRRMRLRPGPAYAAAAVASNHKLPCGARSADRPRNNLTRHQKNAAHGYGDGRGARRSTWGRTSAFARSLYSAHVAGNRR